MTIRPLTEADIKQAAALLADCFPDPWSETSLKEELTEPCACMLIAEEAALCGLIHLHITGTQWTVNTLAVSPAFRRKGIADRLLFAAMEEAERRGGRQGYLEVRAGNTPARRLYQKHGFYPVGTRKNFYRDPAEDAIIMAYGEERT